MDPILIALIVGALILVAYFIPNRRGKSSKQQPKRKTIIVKTFNDVNDQSIVMPGPERIRRIKSPFLPHGELLEYYTPGVTTLYENFLHGIKASEDGPCLGFRPTRTEPYQWISYQTVHDRAVAFGSGLIASGNPSGGGNSQESNTLVGRHLTFEGWYARKLIDYPMSKMHFDMPICSRSIIRPL